MTTALITGASTGIGAAFAQRLAVDGLDLVLVARRADKLDALATELRASTGVSVTVLARDLSTPTAATDLFDECERAGFTIDFLLNNAGYGAHGLVADADAAALANQVQLNCVTLTALTTLFLKGMHARGRGTIVNVASNAAFQPLPQMAVYGATKAFVLSFTEALWRESQGTGVRVLALCPGPTDTAFFDVAGEDFAGSRKRTTDQLVATCKRALARNQPSVVDGPGNALVARVGTRLLPRRALLWGAEKYVAPRA